MAEIRTISSSGGEKGTKPQAYDLISPLALMKLAELYNLGVLKYKVRNFIRGYEYSKSYSSLQRHVSLFWSGESIDSELKSNHIANVAWHAITLLTFSTSHPEFDDRPTVVNKAEGVNIQVNIDSEFPTSHKDDYAADRNGQEEPRFDIIPLHALSALAELYGSKRVQPIRTEGRLWSDAYNRLQEHANLFWMGETYDKHGVNNMVYVLHYCFELLELYYRFPEYDDRFTEALGALPIGFNSEPKPKDD